ncbi:putative DNA/RNA-binding protein Alba [Helianthus annuus]|nr:putative DNA/RNA-binding protein Alba [Helianthus annuus]KAJ0597194.1 putative DNA/RNA-binding protein Alba [Helianthus annuus]KAJ0761542.1 putative DNA/RNA-binding protein Alba [Helianthus annuus]KAJ0927116.1 putative DNA/RNA-binding protein Alba [Helianthus annuus]
MDRYTKVDQKKPDIPISQNEIRITSQGLVRNYISYASTLLQAASYCERREKEIVLKGMGQAISKTVAIAEIVKRNIPRLHQDTSICSISITDVWEPNEEGLLPVEMTRQVSMISITLSTKELNKDSPGYQAPLYVERSKPQYNGYQRQQPRQTQRSYNEEPYGGNYHGNRGRGQGGAVRGRGWNRGGGYGNGGYGNGGYGNGGYGNGGYANGGYGSYQRGDGYRNYQGGRGPGNYRGGRGYGNFQGGGGGGEYGNYHGGGEYRNYQDNNGYSNRSRGGGRGGNAGYHGGGYMRGGRGGGMNGRGGRGRMGGAE